MAGYTKLFSTIITSSIWSEDDKTRIMWITMLATADSRGHVDGSIPGMADMARMSVADAERAIARLEAPDPYSRTKDDEGRRIVPEEGGWRILNYAYYREKGRARERTDYMKEYMQNRRRRKPAVSRCQPAATTATRKQKQKQTITDSSLDRWSSVVRVVEDALGEDRGHERLLSHIANSLVAAAPSDIEAACTQIESLVESAKDKDNPHRWFQAAAAKQFGYRNGEAGHGKRKAR